MPGSTTSPAGSPTTCGLARSAPVSGRVIDEDGKPMADVDVRLGNVQAASGGRYQSPIGV